MGRIVGPHRFLFEYQMSTDGDESVNNSKSRNQKFDEKVPVHENEGFYVVFASVWGWRPLSGE